jgi:hypothetical protein
MQTIAHTTSNQQPQLKDRKHVISGVVLISLGLFFLLAQVVDIGWLFLPLLAGSFIVAGIVTRKAGWFIPGGILVGNSLGSFLLNGPYQLANGDAKGGAFLLAFALGWATITLLSKLFTNETQWWALVPAGIMALIGGSLLAGSAGQQLLNYANYIWPVALIVAGLYFLLRRTDK